MKSVRNKNTGRRSSCPIACALDLIGDKWSLVIIRDMHVFGKTRYDEFLASPERISTNILADRLKKLEENNLITKTPYGSHSQRMSYELTEKGISLRNILKELAAWGLDNIAETKTPVPKKTTTKPIKR